MGLRVARTSRKVGPDIYCKDAIESVEKAQHIKIITVQEIGKKKLREIR